MPARMEDGCGLHGVPWTKMQLTDKRLFLFLGPFSSCELADQQKQTEIQAPNSPKLLDQTPNYRWVRAWRVHRDAVVSFCRAQHCPNV